MLYYRVVLTFVLIIFFCNKSLADRCRKNTSKIISACQEKHPLPTLSKIQPKIIDVTRGATVHLFCSFCNEKNDYKPKLWHYRQRGKNITTEIEELNMGTEACPKHFIITPSHLLIIQNFQIKDAGVYICHVVDEVKEPVFSYVLDEIYFTNISHVRGTEKFWKDFKRMKIDPLNEKLDKADVQLYGNNIHISFKLIFSWVFCDTFDSPYDRKKNTKVGKCRLRPLPRDNITKIDNLTAYYLVDNYDLSCYCMKLYEDFGEISKIVRKIPELEIVLDTHGEELVAFKNISNEQHVVRKQLGENGHITLTCPKTGGESKTDWYKNDELLNTTFRTLFSETEEEPHLIIDEFNSLYILHATKNEEGFYMCTVNGTTRQIYNIQVVSRAKLLNQEFIRYSIYLGFVLSLTITCYCTGMCVAWHRRSSFADPLNLRRKNNIKSYGEYEKLLK